MPLSAMMKQRAGLNLLRNTHLVTGEFGRTIMIGFLARIVTALVGAALLLVVATCAFAAEIMFDHMARRRLTTHLRRNRSLATQSYQTRFEEAQS